MKKTDIIIELDYHSHKWLQDSFMHLNQCKPDLFSFHISDKVEHNRRIHLWNLGTQFRGKIHGEIMRSDRNKIKRVKLKQLLKYADYCIHWFGIRAGWSKECFIILKDEKHPPNYPLTKLAEESHNAHTITLDKMKEFKNALRYLFLGSPKPQMKYMHWLVDKNFEYSQVETGQDFTNAFDFKYETEKFKDIY